VQHRDQIWAFDAESNLLTFVGLMDGQLAGYVSALDRLVFVHNLQTVLLDPRTGETTVPDGSDVPFVGFGQYDFFAADGTVFIGAMVDPPFEGCGFNPVTLAWDLCLRQVSPSIESFVSRVENQYNNRVVLIHQSIGTIDSVWALDMATGQMIELLAASE
jgi:hypothetical protein